MPDPRIFPWDSENAGVAVVPAASAVVIAANGHRTGLDLVNRSNPSEAISLGFGADAVNGEGKVLTVYGSTYHMGTYNLFLGDIYAICPSGDMNMAYSEELKP